MKILICGSRGWHDANVIRTILIGHKAAAHGNLVVIHGGADGADKIADRVARRLGIRVVVEEADWDQYGKAAGPIRNQKMLDDHNPDVVYAFRAHGKSNGTDHMVAISRKAGIQTYVLSGQEESDEQLF